MKLENAKFTVTVDDQSGATTGIYDKGNSYNWILSDGNWGLVDSELLVDGFTTQSVSQKDEKIIVTMTKNRPIIVQIEKRMEKDSYVETYIIKNEDIVEYFMTKDCFGIPFPYDCLYTPGQDILNKCCISHVWCGGDCSWIYSLRCHGDAPYLVMKVTEGAIEDYSIAYDVSRTNNGSFYRGAIVLHPKSCVIAPGESKCLEFKYYFTEEKPENASLTEPNEIRLSASKYSVLQNEEFTICFESNCMWKTLKLSCDGKELPYTFDGNRAVSVCSFETTGERKILAEADGRKTWIFVQVLLPVLEILKRRANFIVEKQQFRYEGSKLDGAYLIYDSDNDSLYFSEGFGDHNASRERLAMGVIVCKAIQLEYDDVKMESLRRHRAFVEREMFDADSGVVYNQVGHDSSELRVFNFPWMSTYYLEWYELTKEKQCIINAAKILLNFFEITNCTRDAQCMEVVRICDALQKEGLDDLREALKTKFLRYADQIRFGKANMKDITHILETSYVSERPNEQLCYLSQAYLLEPKDEYRLKAEDKFLETKAFFANQPDFHMNCINVRYWDRYWFGKHRSYGDLFPHYWSSLAGWGMLWFNSVFGNEEAKKLAERNLTGNLCVYREDGFAANNYFYPYKVKQYSSKEHKPHPCMEHGIFYGKKYDAWANDQDWALYYALMLIE
ncbi:MAG: hypothetical protein IJB70_02515 [Clostridia bacterium]|nr:hypothetical protein [Clostridia bacterium]